MQILTKYTADSSKLKQPKYVLTFPSVDRAMMEQCGRKYSLALFIYLCNIMFHVYLTLCGSFRFTVSYCFTSALRLFCQFNQMLFLRVPRFRFLYRLIPFFSHFSPRSDRQRPLICNCIEYK